jgi:uncharacterized protein
MNLPLPGAERFDNYAQVHALSFPVDQMVAFTALAMGRVLDRFPALRVAFLESGVGWVPYFVRRMHEHREKRGDMVPEMTSDPRDYIERGQCFFAFECEDQLLEPYVQHLDAASLVFSSDYPHWEELAYAGAPAIDMTAASVAPTIIRSGTPEQRCLRRGHAHGPPAPRRDRVNARS